MIPTHADMNMTDPEEHLLWALVGIGGRTGAPLLMPTSIMRAWSAHLYDCGFRHHPEAQTIRYIPPREDAAVLEAGAGQWVPIDTPDPAPPADHPTTPDPAADTAHGAERAGPGAAGLMDRLRDLSAAERRELLRLIEEEQR